MHPEVNRQWYSPILETTASTQGAASNSTITGPGLEGQDYVRRAVLRSARASQHSLQDRAKALPSNRPWPRIYNQPQSRHAGMATELHKTGQRCPCGKGLTDRTRGDAQLVSQQQTWSSGISATTGGSTNTADKRTKPTVHTQMLQEAPWTDRFRPADAEEERGRCCTISNHNAS